jgi:hypothetical protein
MYTLALQKGGFSSCWLILGFHKAMDKEYTSRYFYMKLSELDKELRLFPMWESTSPHYKRLI